MEARGDLLQIREVYREERNNAYRAIGRYLVEFSRFVLHMRFAVEQRLARPEDPPELTHIVLGDATANTIADVFFGVCRVVGNLTDPEEAVREKLHHETVYKTIPRRNDVAHGDWWIGWGSGEKPDPPAYVRATRGRTPTYTELPVADLDKRTDALREFRMLVMEFGQLCMGQHPEQRQEKPLRPGDLFVLRGKKGVRRDGPRAADIPPMFYP